MTPRPAPPAPAPAPASPNARAVPLHRSVAAKALLVLTLVVVAVTLVTGYYALRGARSLLKGQLSERGLVLARNLAINSGYGVFTEDLLTLNRLLDGVMAEPDVLFAVITDKDGKPLARRVRGGQDAALAGVQSRLPGADAEAVSTERTGEDEFLLLSAPVRTRESVIADQEETFLIGFLDLGFSPDERLEIPREERTEFRGMVHLGLSTADIAAGMGEVTRRVVVLTLIVILAGIVISALLVRLLTKPLLAMTHVTAQVARGDLSAKMDVRGGDEVALLGTAFNRMTDALHARDDEIRRSHERLAAANRELGDLNAHLEERVAQRTRELEASNRELVLATERKSRFMANLAHELRTPLNSVIGFSEALRDGLLGELTEKQLRYVENIVTGGRHILEMSGGILDLAKIEAGSVEVRLEPLDVAQALHEIVTITEPQAARKGLTVKVALGGLDGRRAYVADRGKFKQVLYNLVSNAIKFSPRGTAIEVAAHTRNDHLEVRVSDHGPGVPEAAREEIFEEFRQLEPDEAAGGSGLGLSISRKLVELHGGRIRVSDTDGGGATFTVELPENPPPPPGSSPAA
jgi:signal transduction histidine kinase